MVLTPALILTMWVGGIAAGGAVVASWRVVGPGYLWLVGSVVAAFAAVAGLAGGGPAAWVAVPIALLAVVVARRPPVAASAFAASSAALLVATLTVSPVLAALSGTILMGGITSEMMLGHWYLVDPTLPRRPLLALDAVAGSALVVDAMYVATVGSITFSGANGVFAMAYVALAIFTGVLIVGVWFSLREPSYSGVMAATGLSYLAVLTTFGVVTLGRSLVTGGL